MTNAQEATSQELDDRYGRRSTRGIDRVVLIVVGSIILIGVVFWALFSGWNRPDASLEFRDIGHSIVDERQVNVTFEVTVPPGREVACTVEALNGSFATVGWKVVTLEASEKRTRGFEQSLVTTNLANTGTVSNCWILNAS